MPLPQAKPMVIGVTGPIGAGVTTISSILKQNGFKGFRASDPIRLEMDHREPGSVAKLSQTPAGRAKLQDLGNELRRNHHRGILVEHLLQDDSGDTPIVVDGIRNAGEVEWLRNRFPATFIVAVVADRDIRWGRVKDQSVYNGNEKLFDTDDERDWDLEEDDKHGQQVQQCVLLADFVLLNNEHLGAYSNHLKTLEKQLMPSIELMRGGGDGRAPYPDEVHMATAYSQSHGSQCLKRHVGAVIVDTDGIALTVGYNENPVGTMPCKIKWNYCFKDNDMEERLSKMPLVYCPSCGESASSPAAPWKCTKCKKDLRKTLFTSRNLERCTAIHAEERAVRNLPNRTAKGATMYVTTFPCFQCARYIIDAGIKKVVFVEAYPVKESLDFLKLHNVEVQPFAGFKARAFNVIFKGVR